MSTVSGGHEGQTGMTAGWARGLWPVGSGSSVSSYGYDQAQMTIS